MTKEELASMLNGREYREEITREEERIAEDNGLVVMFGYSDDNVELGGAIHDEISAYDGTTILFLNGKALGSKCHYGDTCGTFEELKKLSCIKSVEALWCEEDGYSWTFKTDIPHATFEILEDNEKFCRGIVFDINSIKEN